MQRAWLNKIKADRRRISADAAVIVSVALPDAVKASGVGRIDGVWVRALLDAVEAKKEVAAMRIAQHIRGLYITLIDAGAPEASPEYQLVSSSAADGDAIGGRLLHRACLAAAKPKEMRGMPTSTTPAGVRRMCVGGDVANCPRPELTKAKHWALSSTAPTPPTMFGC